MSELNRYLKEIGKKHHNAILERSALVILGSSVIRVFKTGTKKDVFKILKKLPVPELKSISNESQFQKWFNIQLNKIYSALKKKNQDNHSVQPGLKWGHATKILCLYLREVVLNSRYFSDKEIHRIQVNCSASSNDFYREYDRINQ